MMFNALSSKPSWHGRSGAQLWSGSPGSSRTLIGAGVLILLAMTAAMAVTILQMRAAGLTEARQNLGKLGMAIAEQTSRSVQAGSLVLDDLRREILASGPETPEEFEAAARTFALHSALAARTEILP